MGEPLRRVKWESERLRRVKWETARGIVQKDIRLQKKIKAAIYHVDRLVDKAAERGSSYVAYEGVHASSGVLEGVHDYFVSQGFIARIDREFCLLLIIDWSDRDEVVETPTPETEETK